MEVFVTLVTGFQLLPNVKKNFVLDVAGVLDIEAVTDGILWRKVFLKHLQILQENACDRSSI